MILSELKAWEENNTLPARAVRALDETDNMSPAMRECVHEFGYAIVKSCMTAGITKPEIVRQLVKEIWHGARQPAQQNRIGRQHSPVVDSLDWVLIQAGAQITAKTLLRILWQNSMVILPREPGTVMIEASVGEVNDFTQRITKSEKHRRRLRAAIQAQARRLWPHLFQ